MHAVNIFLVQNTFRGSAITPKMLDFKSPMLIMFYYHSYITPPWDLCICPSFPLKTSPRFHMSCSLISNDTSLETLVLPSFPLSSSSWFYVSHDIFYYLKLYYIFVYFLSPLAESHEYFCLVNHCNPRPGILPAHRRQLINICSMTKRMKCFLRKIRFLWKKKSQKWQIVI